MVVSYAPEGMMVAMRAGQLQLRREDVAELLAHDLRTPLAALALNVEYALGELGADAPPEVRSALEDCGRATHQSVTLVADMMDAMHLTSGELRLELDDVDVQATLAEAARAVAPDAAARGVRLMWSAEPALVHADAGLLARAIERVLERAVRQARSGGSIDVTLRKATIVVRVRAPDSDVVPMVVDVGVRALATHFADTAMRAQGGAVWTESDGDGALLFCIALPTPTP